MSSIPVYLTMTVAISAGLVGIYAIFDPARALNTFGMPATSPESLALGPIYGVRSFFMATVFTWLGIKGYRRLMSQFTIPLAVMGVVDCWTIYNHGLSGKWYGHFIGTGIVLGLGYWLSQDGSVQVKRA